MGKCIRLLIRTIGVLVAGAALSAGAITLAPAAASADATGSITGTVSYSGTGVAVVCIDAFSGGGSAGYTTTASDGTYTINGLSAGSYDVQVNPSCQGPSSYASQTLTSVAVTAGEATTENVSLTAGGSVTGTVSYNGTGVAGVCVDAVGPGASFSSEVVTTSADGTFTITGLTVGMNQVFVDPTCFATVTSAYASQNLSSVSIVAGATTTVNVSLTLGSSVTGTVSYNGTGVSGVCVDAVGPGASFSSGIVTTGADGTFTISGLTVGTNQVFVDPTCYGTVASPYASQNLTSVAVVAGATTTVDVSLTLGSSITGTVSYNGTGVAGVCVDAYSSDGGASYGNATTASDGTYTIDGLYADSYDIRFEPTCEGSSTYANQTVTSVAVAAASTTVDVSLTLGGSITGTVSYNGTGVAGVCVDAYASDGGEGGGFAITASDGTYTIDGVGVDSYDVQVDPTCEGPSSYLSQTLTSVAVTAGEATTELVNLTLAGSVTGTVSYNGTGVAGVCVDAVGPGASFSSGIVTTGADGTFTITGLTVGMNQVEADPTCHGTVTSPYASQNLTSVSVVAGATTTVDVSLALGGSITGTVSYNGTGVAGVCIFAFSGDGTSNGFATTASDGTYTMDGLAVDSYTVQVDPTCDGSSLYANQVLTSVTVSADAATTENFSLALGGSITGTVSYNGTGVAGVCVDAYPSDGGEGLGFALTAGDGTYTIDGLGVDSYDVLVDPTCEGLSAYLIQTLTSVAVTAGETTTENVTLSVAVTDDYSFAGGGGKGTAPASGNGLDGSTITLPANTFTNAGYTFAGWSDGTTTYAAGATYALSSGGAPITFTAQWAANATDHFSFAGGAGTGTAPASGSGLDGTTITLPGNTFTNAGYSFAGWSDGTTTYAAGATYALSSGGAPITFTAQWAANATDHFSFAGGAGTGTAPASGSGLDGTTITLPENTFTDAGYTFAGWSDGTTTYFPGALYTLSSGGAAITFTAQWTANPTSHFSFASGGGTGTAPASGSGLDGTTITLPANTFTHGGYIFSGWSDGTTTYAAGAVYTLSGASITFIAQWTANPTDHYSFAGGASKGSAPASGSGLDGTTITLPANTFTYAGYVFAGWSDGTKTYAAGATYTLSSGGAAITFTAQWTHGHRGHNG